MTYKTAFCENKPPHENAAPRKARTRKAPRKITPEYLHNAGLYYLQRFAASREGFRSVMLRKVARSCRAHPDQDYEACAALVDMLVEKFSQAGLLNDEMYTRGAVTSLRRQGKSRRMILARLQMKGVEESYAQQKLAEHDEAQHEGEGESAEISAALKLARKKKLLQLDLKDKAAYARAMSIMARAGFSFDTARLVLGRQMPDSL